jgi:hydrogenase-4 component B
MITAPQLRAARALLGIDQRQLAAMAGLSVPTIQRMEASDGVIRGNVDSLMKLIAALELAGIDLIAEGAVSPSGGRGVRLKAALTSLLTLPLGLPWLGAHFRLDALAAFFLLVVNLGSAAASLYGLGYGRHETAPHRVLPFFPAFLAGMNLVVLADDAFTFLLSWEFMSLSSWALVMAHHRDRDNARAGYVYLVMASFGTLALLLAFGLLAGTPAATTSPPSAPADQPPVVTALVLGLVLLGAGSKAGLVPLHVWLPLAHPAAPSHVSALMSGVMTKVAVYGFIRIVFDLAGEPDWWSGMVVLLLGGVTAVLGVLYALMQHDLKRLLAYQHGREHRHYLHRPRPGARLPGQRHGLGGGAGAHRRAVPRPQPCPVQEPAVLRRRRRALSDRRARHGSKLGGLIHRMPYTSFAFLVGCVAISALPPLNGFVSEWLTFQAILQSPELPQWGLKIMVPAVGAMLALSAALAAACFVKAFGITFLGRPRSPAAEGARDVDRFSLAPCSSSPRCALLAGILPGFVIDALAPVTQALVGGAHAGPGGDPVAVDRAHRRKPQLL